MNLNELTTNIKAITLPLVASLRAAVNSADEIFLIGNGGSNAIASHMAVDYTKFLKIKCCVPNTADMLSMIVNDYGQDEMYSRFIRFNVDNQKDQLAILISSSGNSVNILKAAEECNALSIPMILLSSFDENNKLNVTDYSNTVLKFWCPATSYGVAEMTHHVFLHSIV